MGGFVVIVGICGLLSGTAMVCVGTFLSLYMGHYLADLLGTPPGPVILSVIAAHFIPLVFLFQVFRAGNLAPKWMGVAMLVVSPATAYLGIDGLVIRGDYRDFLLWAPYLLTGVCLAFLGGTIVAGRYYN